MKLLKQLSVLALTLLAFFDASRAATITDDTVYIGTLGGRPIVLKLEINGEYTNATYFYRRYGRNIELRADPLRRGSVFRLIEISQPETPVAQVLLEFNVKGLRGSWNELGGRKRVYKIALRRARTADFARLELPTDLRSWLLKSPFEALRFDRALQSVKIERIEGRRVQWLTEAKSQTIFVRLPDSSADVNRILQTWHYLLIDEALSCTGKFRHTPRVALYSKRLLSIRATSLFFCSGGYSGIKQENFTLDVKKAQQLALEDLYRFTPLKVPDSQSSAAYTVFRNARATALQRLILMRYGSLTTQAGCKEVLARDSGLSHLSWFLTPKGLVVRNSLADPMSQCEQEFLLPYASLTPYLAPDSPLK